MELTKELHKPIIRNYKKLKVYSTFIDNIWGANLADTQLLSRFIKGICLLPDVIDIFSKHAFVIYLKDKKASQLLVVSKNSKMNLIANQTKYESIKAVSFTTDQLNHGYKIII